MSYKTYKNKLGYYADIYDRNGIEIDCRCGFKTRAAADAWAEYRFLELILGGEAA